MNSSNTWYTDVMVDVETTGTAPDRAGVLQIGAIRFNLENLSIDSNVFNQSLTLPAFRHWDEGTRAWWGDQKPGILDDIMSRARPSQEVMQEFFDWSLEYPNLRFWAKPLSFDFPFISGYFRDHDLMNPYHYRVARDLNSYVEALHYGEEIPQVELEDFGDAHNALNDCWMQLDYLFKHIEYRRNKNVVPVVRPD